jgi:hypothetical protein
MDYTNRAWVLFTVHCYGIEASEIRANSGFLISTEGDVEGIMDRPTGDGSDVQAEREKW